MFKHAAGKEMFAQLNTFGGHAVVQNRDEHHQGRELYPQIIHTQRAVGRWRDGKQFLGGGNTIEMQKINSNKHHQGREL